MVVAKARFDENEKDLYNFIINKPQKRLSELITTAWRMHDAADQVSREKRSRMDILEEHFKGQCVAGCGGQWLTSAKEVLRNNGVNVFAYADAVRQTLQLGRQKKNNLMIVGGTNSGKSFLFDPIELMYKAFVNPAPSHYAWIGLDECEAVFLNDFRYDEKLIKWSDFLLLLEGATVHLPRPRNQFATDIKIDRTNTIPFFATSKGPIEYSILVNSM